MGGSVWDVGMHGCVFGCIHGSVHAALRVCVCMHACAVVSHLHTHM